jgi:hypothetical protein
MRRFGRSVVAAEGVVEVLQTVKAAGFGVGLQRAVGDGQQLAG